MWRKKVKLHCSTKLKTISLDKLLLSIKEFLLLQDKIRMRLSQYLTMLDIKNQKVQKGYRLSQIRNLS